MNIEPEFLKPRSYESFLEQIQQQGKEMREYMFQGVKGGHLSNEELAQTRYNHYQKRRYQALSILNLRYEEKRHHEFHVPEKQEYDPQINVVNT